MFFIIFCGSKLFMLNYLINNNIIFIFYEIISIIIIIKLNI